MLVDTHCHLDFPQFDSDRQEVIERARQQGVARIINVGATLNSSRACCKLACGFDGLYAAVGVHPHDADSFDLQAQAELRELAKSPKVVAVGETGLDYYRNLSPADNQKQAFRKQLLLALDMGLPLIIHSRQAEKDTLAILKEMPAPKAVVHCFSSGEDFLKECLDMGLYLSFTCNITYSKAQALREIVKIVPLEKVMLETDAPYLSPQTQRGKRNEPANVAAVAEELARIKGVGFERVCEVTTENAFRFFSLK